MSWHDDKQRRMDAEQARAIKEEQVVVRKRAARRAYEAGRTLEEVAAIAQADRNTVKKWARDGGWKRDDHG